MKMTAKTRAIDKIYKRRDRYEIPEWQRQEVWSNSKKQHLLDTILRGWRLPKFYFLKTSDEPENYEVVDGQQRLATIFQFFEDDLSLSKESAKLFGGFKYSDLPDAIADPFDDYEIEFDEIEDASDEEVKDFFQRLQLGVQLTASEKLNSIPSKLRDFVKKGTKHKFFAKISASDRRYGHFDILAKVATMELEGIDAGLRYDDMKAVFLSHAMFSPASNIGKRLTAALDFAYSGFADGSGGLKNRTLVQSLLTMICRLIQSPEAMKQHRRVAAFFVEFQKELKRQVELGQQATDEDYLRFQKTINANVKSGARIRQEILLRKLFSFDPAFAELLDTATVAESGLRSAVSRDAQEIVYRIASLNEQYAAKHGENLITTTNRTLQAQTRLGNAVKNFDEYKRLVDDLYFLFREGVGARLDGQTLKSFNDVNVLRTDLRHDVEHGKKNRIRSKKLKSGEVFKSYSGSTSPVGLGDDKFVMVQANLLSAIKRDIVAIKI